MNDGGPAFPLATTLTTYGKPEGTTYFAEGMSLRDWFAGQLVGGFIHVFPLESWEYYAEAAYGLADAMLKEREKR